MSVESGGDGSCDYMGEREERRQWSEGVTKKLESEKRRKGEGNKRVSVYEELPKSPPKPGQGPERDSPVFWNRVASVAD